MRRVLVANRGEIALRAIRVCRRTRPGKRCRLQFGRRQFLPSLGCRSRHLHRSAATEIELSERRRADRDCRRAEMRRHLSGLWLSRREPRLRRAQQASRSDLHRSRQRLHRPHGRQSRGAPSRGCRRHSRRPRLRTRLHGGGAGQGGQHRDRISPAAEGKRRRRRPRHADRRSRRRFRRPVRAGLRRGAGGVRQCRSLSRAILPAGPPHRNPGVRRPATAITSISANAIAACSAATRSWSRKRPLLRSTTPPAIKWRKRRLP